MKEEAGKELRSDSEWRSDRTGRRCDKGKIDKEAWKAARVGRGSGGKARAKGGTQIISTDGSQSVPLRAASAGGGASHPGPGQKPDRALRAGTLVSGLLSAIQGDGDRAWGRGKGAGGGGCDDWVGGKACVRGATLAVRFADGDSAGEHVPAEPVDA